MKYFHGLWVVVILLWCWPTPAQIPGVAESHIEGNAPGAKDFRPLLLQSLRTDLQLKYGNKLIVNYELLRDVPTQSGVGSPKFYLWLTATKNNKLVVEGVASVAAIDQRQFEVLRFVPRADIMARLRELDRVFPAELVPKILERLNLDE